MKKIKTLFGILNLCILIIITFINTMVGALLVIPHAFFLWDIISNYNDSTEFPPFLISLGQFYTKIKVKVKNFYLLKGGVTYDWGKKVENCLFDT